MAETDQTGSYTYANRAGQIVTVPKKGIRTSAWEELISVREIDSPYDIKYGEERHGLPCAPAQFGLLTLSLDNDIGVKDNITLMDV